MENTLTATQAAQGPMLAFLQLSSRTDSSVRRIPYAEVYRASTGLYQTPAEQLQEAAEDERDREAAEREEDSS